MIILDKSYDTDTFFVHKLYLSHPTDDYFQLKSENFIHVTVCGVMCCRSIEDVRCYSAFYMLQM